MPAAPLTAMQRAFSWRNEVLNNILSLIINTVVSVLGGVMLLRFWMQAIRVRPPNSIGQFTSQLSDWLIRPLRRVVPGIGGYDWASLLGAFLVVLLGWTLELWFANSVTLQSVLVLSVMRLLEWALYGLIGLILIDVVFSWVNPQAPLAPFIQALGAPVMRPLRRIIPLIGNIDLSSLVALVLLQIALRFVATLTGLLL